VRAEGRFIGCVGLTRPSFEAPFTPCTEVSWRLARESWGHGYATEAARACLGFAFEELALGEVLAFTTPGNVRSWAVMRRLGMTCDRAEDFEHPRLPPGHRLRHHLSSVLARASQAGIIERIVMV
jgi:RimJ/RimL family protein N-acetyltransferase